MDIKPALAVHLEEDDRHPVQRKAEEGPGRQQVRAPISTIYKIWGICLAAVIPDLWMGFGFLRSAGWQARSGGLFHALGMILFMFAAGITRWLLLTHYLYPSNSSKLTFKFLAAVSMMIGVLSGAQVFLMIYGTSFDLAYTIFTALVGGVFGASSGYILCYIFWQPVRIEHGRMIHNP